MDYLVVRNDELYHHGILNMKWGVRRYQNPDGSLTEAGKKRYSKLQSKMEKLSPSGPPKEERKKSVKEMSDDELKTAIERMRLEKDYYDRQQQLYPVKTSVFKKTFDKFQNETAPNMINKMISDNVTNLVNKYANAKIDQFITGRFDTASDKLKKASDDANNRFNIQSKDMLTNLLKEGKAVVTGMKEGKPDVKQVTKEEDDKRNKK